MSEQTPENPMQPIVIDDGIYRFKQNKIVRYLLDYATKRGMGLNELADMGYLFTADDREQLLQLIGYSVSGFGELDYVRPESIEKADAIVANMSQ